MNPSALLAIVVGLCISLFGCATHKPDPAGEGASKNALADTTVLALPELLNLAELERRCGPSEGQPGPRVTYRSADHQGKFFWVYYSSPQNTQQPSREKITIHHILLADALEEGSEVVWPRRWAGRSASEAADDLMHVFNPGQSKSANGNFEVAPSSIDQRIDGATIEDYILALPKFAFHEETVAAFATRVRHARMLPENAGKGRNYLYCPGDGCWPAKDFLLEPASHRLTIKVHGDGESSGYTTIMRRAPGGWFKES